MLPIPKPSGELRLGVRCCLSGELVTLQSELVRVLGFHEALNWRIESNSILSTHDNQLRFMAIRNLGGYNNLSKAHSICCTTIGVDDGRIGLQATVGTSNGQRGLADYPANKAGPRRPRGYIGVVVQPQVQAES